MQFGYICSLPLLQLPEGKGHELWALLQVTPRDAKVKSQSSFFLRHYELPPVLDAQFSASFEGAVQAKTVTATSYVPSPIAHQLRRDR